MTSNTKRYVLFSSKGRKQTLERQNNPIKKRLLTVAVIFALLVGLYCTAIFSNIPFIKKWRVLYIETAMDTYSHKWLATFFIPKSIIDDVLANKEAVINSQQDLQSSWEPDPSESAPASGTTDDSTEKDPMSEFLALYSEIEPESFSDYISRHPELTVNGYDKLLINEAGLKDKGTTICTNNGDQILAIDAENGLLIVGIKGDGYVARLAIVKNPSQVKLGYSKMLGEYGQTVQKIAEDNNAVLAVNASGFTDDEKKGNGGEVVGLLIADGKLIHKPVHKPYLTIGFSKDDKLNIGIPIDKLDYRDAVEFVPALIINGEEVIKDKKLVDGSMGFGIQPRTVIGQKKDGTVFLMTVDGRQIGYSLGCTVVECADVLMKYGAYEAANLDGGSSTVMVYRGEVITKPANGTDYGRFVPDAFLVTYANSKNT